MKKVFPLLVVIITFATSSITYGADKAQLAADLMKVLGFSTMLDSARKDTMKMVEDQINSMTAQLRNANPTMPDSVLKDFHVAAQEFSRRINTSWDPAEAARIYSTALVEGLPESDMRAAIAYYKTEKGQRELRVINDAAKQTNGYILESVRKETDAAMKDFLAQIKSIVEKARQEREKQSYHIYN